MCQKEGNPGDAMQVRSIRTTECNSGVEVRPRVITEVERPRD
jgi:hypothetical protein